jgi:hypothetical protein
VEERTTYDSRFRILFRRPTNKSNLMDSFDQSIEAVHSVNVCSTSWVYWTTQGSSSTVPRMPKRAYIACAC